MKKRVLITGGCGFIGANLARRMLRDGHDVYLLATREHTGWRIEDILSDVRIVDADLRDGAALLAAIPPIRPDWIFHLAAHGAYSYQTDTRRIAETNYMGTVNLLEACLAPGFEAFINTGTSSEYGLKDHPPAENEWLEPNSAYAASKAGATQHCRYVALSRKLPIRTLRLYSAYGPYEEPTRLIPNLIVNGLNGAFPPLVNPAVARDFVHTDDVMEAYLAAATAPNQPLGGVYNVGSGVQTTLGEAVATVRRLLKIETEPAWGSMPDRHWDTTIWVADSSLIRRTIGWSPRLNFEAGMKRLIDWYAGDPKMLEHYNSAILKGSMRKAPR